MRERTAVLVGPHMADKEIFYVMREDTCLGRIVDCEFDFPRWFGRFEADDAFAQVAPLFSAMFDALKNGRIEECNKLLVEAANLNLVVKRVGEDESWPVFFRVLVPQGFATFQVDTRRT